eukprot:gene3580-4084_t
MQKLGISNSSIVKDGQLSASSYLYSGRKGVYHYMPYYGRLRSRSGGGSWCSAATSEQHFLQVDFLRNIRVNYVETQGRFQGAEYVGLFKVAYQRDGDAVWRVIRDDSGKEKVFSANKDIDSVVGNSLPYSIVARKVRINPTDDLFAIQCLRMEMYGCQLQSAANNLLSYSSPPGLKLGKFDFTDSSYDGVRNKTTLLNSNGIGRLVDGFRGSNDFKGWVGFNLTRVELVFRFSKIRRFTGIVLFTRTLSKNDIFLDIEISTSEDGVLYTLANMVSRVKVKTTGSRNSVRFVANRAVWVKCVTRQEPGNFLLISEVMLHQEDPKIPTTTSMSKKLPKRTLRPSDRFNLLSTVRNTEKNDVWVYNNFDLTTKRKLGPLTSPPSNEAGSPHSRGGSKRTKSFYIILGVATFVAAIFALLIVLLVWFLKRDKSESKNAGRDCPKGKLGSDSTNVSEPLLKAIEFQGVCGASRYACPAMVLEDPMTDKEISRAAIQYENKIGGGKFGEVFIGQIICPKDGSLGASNHSLVGQKVFIEMLKKGASVDTRAKLSEEIQALSCLRHPNICRLVAVCSKGGPKLLLSESLEGMRLDSYLGTLNLSATANKSEILADIVVKISNAMKYLASIRIVHRDISARNVIYGVGGVVKLTNTAAACPGYYDCYYYMKDKRSLCPIRWMAPETLCDAQLTVQSDVWSFGVLLWEIYTFAKVIPLEAMSNLEVLRQLEMLSSTGPRSVEYLPLKFLNCPVLIWKVMRSCWTVGSAHRITAEQIYETLTS